MASTEKLPSGRYRPIVRDAAGNKVRGLNLGTFRLKSDAQNAANKAEVEVRSAAPKKPVSVSALITWGEWWDSLAPKRVFESDYATSQGSYVRNHVRPRWGHVALNDISGLEVQDWINEKVAAGYAPATVACIFKPLSVSVKTAVEKGILTASPVAAVKIPRAKRKAKNYLPQDELPVISAVLRQDYADALNFCMETGLRPSEMAGLHIDQIDEAGFMVVRTVYVSLQKRMRDQPKDGDVRVVPLTAEAIEIVQRRMHGRNGQRGCGVEHFGRSGCESEIVFRTVRGDPIDTRVFASALRTACRRTNTKRRTPYSTRRGFATILGRANVDVFRLMDLMGWADPKLAREYVQESPGAREELTAALRGTSTATAGAGSRRGSERGTNLPSDPLPDRPLRGQRSGRRGAATSANDRKSNRE